MGLLRDPGVQAHPCVRPVFFYILNFSPFK